jgi:hypothetical protein
LKWKFFFKSKLEKRVYGKLSLPFNVSPWLTAIGASPHECGVLNAAIATLHHLVLRLLCLPALRVRSGLRLGRGLRSCWLILRWSGWLLVLGGGLRRLLVLGLILRLLTGLLWWIGLILRLESLLDLQECDDQEYAW